MLEYSITRLRRFTEQTNSGLTDTLVGPGQAFLWCSGGISPCTSHNNLQCMKWELTRLPSELKWIHDLWTHVICTAIWNYFLCIQILLSYANFSNCSWSTYITVGVNMCAMYLILVRNISKWHVPNNSGLRLTCHSVKPQSHFTQSIILQQQHWLSGTGC